MDIKSLEIKNKTNYDWDDIIYINDFNVILMIFIFVILDMFLTQVMIMIL